MDEPEVAISLSTLEHALESAQRLAIDVIEYPSDKRDEVMRRMGILLTKIALEAGCTGDKAREFGTSMEEAIRSYVAEIEARGGGTVGTRREDGGLFHERHGDCAAGAGGDAGLARAARSPPGAGRDRVWGGDVDAA